MPVGVLPMLDYSQLKAPACDGEVLVAPDAAALVPAARASGEALRCATAPLLNTTLAQCRREARETLLGLDDELVFVTGHDPSFIHPGVWAKHVVAARLAAAVGGVAVNLVVDNNAPRGTALAIPSVSDGRAAVKSVPFARVAPGLAFEQIARRTPAEIMQFRQAVREAMGDRYSGSQMPRFFAGLADATGARDWVDQVVAARQAVEGDFGVFIHDHRVGKVWHSPLLLDMLVHAERFAESYNRALKAYRSRYRVRGEQRPIPDLVCDGKRCEIAVWAYRADEPRRRLFAARTGETLRLFAGEVQIGSVPLRRVGSCDGLDVLCAELGDWRLRPRALTLTLWARLLLADLFIHGIGGAKYDRITDAIIADYYGVTPPAIACVSATLHMGLPHNPTTADSVRRLRHALRDLEHNPQRNLPAAPDIESLIERRADAVRRGVELAENRPGDHAARRAAFNDIRQSTSAILALRKETVIARRTELARAVRELDWNRIALGREYFFGLYDRPGLERLLRALPADRDFRVRNARRADDAAYRCSSF